VINSIISPNQLTFLKGGNLVDGVLVVNEVVGWAKKTHKDCLIFKVDFEKAYDLLDWGYVGVVFVPFGHGRFQWVDAECGGDESF